MATISLLPHFEGLLPWLEILLCYFGDLHGYYSGVLCHFRGLTTAANHLLVSCSLLGFCPLFGGSLRGLGASVKSCKTRTILGANLFCKMGVFFLSKKS